MREIVGFVQKQIDVLNPEAMAEDLSKACSYYYTVASYYAKKEADYSEKCTQLLEAANNDIDRKYTAKDKDLMIKGLASQEKRAVLVAKGLLDSLYVKIESLRTLISKAKEELRITK